MTAAREETKVLVLNPAADRYAEHLGELFGGAVQPVAATSIDEADTHLADTRVLVGMGWELTPAVLERMERLAWVQCLITGTDHLVPLLAEHPDVMLTSASGIHGPQMSEMALLHMLALSRDVRRISRNQIAHHWERLPQRLLHGKSVAIVGVGASGVAIANVCAALGMTVHGVSRTPRELPAFDHFHELGDLAEVAGEVDFLVLTIPYSERTHHLIDAQILARMRPTACLVNIARGRIVDEQALIGALRRAEIAGAGLDVFAERELPPDSPLWEMENVFITPWLAGHSDRYFEQTLPVLDSNMRAFLDGELSAMRNVIAT